MRCDRCNQECVGTIMSVFNTEMICLGCKDKEKRHPQYEEATRAEEQAIREGNYNFPGIGKPADL